MQQKSKEKNIVKKEWRNNSLQVGNTRNIDDFTKDEFNSLFSGYLTGLIMEFYGPVDITTLGTVEQVKDHLIKYVGEKGIPLAREEFSVELTPHMVIVEFEREKQEEMYDIAVLSEDFSTW